MKIFAVRDNAIGAYLQPFFSPTSNAALRSLKEAVNDPKHEFHKHAGDYSMWYLGEFDDSDGGILREVNGPTRIVGCIDLLGID